MKIQTTNLLDGLRGNITAGRSPRIYSYDNSFLELESQGSCTSMELYPVKKISSLSSQGLITSSGYLSSGLANVQGPINVFCPTFSFGGGGGGQL